MPLFEVAVLEKPTKKEMEEGAVEKLLVAPRAIIARSEQAAVIAITRDSAIDGSDFDRLEIKVRPF